MVAMQRVGIIGAGMAGLAAARSLSKSTNVTVFEKERGVGGRMATRRVDNSSFDYGAQYFTVRDASFSRQVKAACEAGLVAVWTCAPMTLPDNGLPKTAALDPTRYVAIPEMDALAKSMSVGLDLRLHTSAGKITGKPGSWYVNAGHASHGPFDWVIVAAPARQAAMLMPELFSHHRTLTGVTMSGCFTLMMRMLDDARLPFKAAWLSDPVIGWIARNHTKPGRASSPTLVVNATASWADANIDVSLDIVRRTMVEALKRHMPLKPAETRTVVIHRWRDADVIEAAGQPFLLDEGNQLGACGDWCIGGRVEAAFMSGSKLADAILAAIGEQE